MRRVAWNSMPSGRNSSEAAQPHLTSYTRRLRGRPDGIFAAPYEQGEIGPDLFKAACDMGLERLVSKRADRLYRAGRSKDWIKIKNRKHPPYRRVLDQF